MADYTPIYKFYEKKIKNCKKCKSSGNQLTRPWIGKEYHRGNPKIVFVGINMNNPGPEDTDLAKFIDNHPKFLSMGLYGFMPRLVKQVFRLQEDDPRKLYEHFAFTNIIKCSPGNDRSKPTNEMWNKCLYIKDEIELLKPEIIIALGSDSYAGLVERFINQREELALSGELQKHMTKIRMNDEVAFIIRVDHPSENRPIRTAKSRLAIVLEFINSESEAYKILSKINARLEYFIAEQLINKAVVAMKRPLSGRS